MKAKTQEIKDGYHQKYKELRNRIVILIRLSKNSYYQTFFTENANNAKKHWKGIKSIVETIDEMVAYKVLRELFFCINAGRYHKRQIKILTWNLNGVKNKYLNEEVCNVFSKVDVIIIQETHFGVRVRCPKDFLFISRPQRVKLKVPRGGVAVYKNVHSDFKIDVICNDLRDCIIMKIRNTELIIAAPYITPHNSLYYDNIYFSNLELIFRKFQS